VRQSLIWIRVPVNEEVCHMRGFIYLFSFLKKKKKKKIEEGTF